MQIRGMVEPESGSNELQVLILGENVQDSEILHNVFADAEIDATVCKDLQDLHAHLLHDAGLLLMAEEALNPHEAGPLMETLCEQPPWSDLPILLLVHAAGESERADWVTAMLGNVTLLERPVHKAELLSAVRSALRARRCQFPVNLSPARWWPYKSRHIDDKIIHNCRRLGPHAEL